MKKNIYTLTIVSLVILLFAAKGVTNLMPPENLMVPPVAKTDNSITLIWGKPVEYSNIISYEIYQDGNLIASTEKLNYTITNLSPDKEYKFSVKSKDKNGNVSKESNIISVSTLKKQPVINIKDFGAVGDRKTLNTKAIQNAIDKAEDNSIVLIPDGTFLSGAIFLKSNITLQIDGTLLGSDNPDDYPYTSKRLSYYTPINYMGLINAYTEDIGSLQNIKITGKGTVNGGTISNDPTLTILGQTQAKLKGDKARGDLITVKGVTNFYMGGIKLINPAEHTIYISYSKNITIDGIDVRTYDIHNGDGVDFAVSENIFLFNSFFDTGDDCINFNAGYGAEGVKEEVSCKNLRIFNCTTQRGHGGVAFGSYTAGWIKDVLVEDCYFEGTDIGIRFKTSGGNGGGANNILLRDIKMKNIVNEAILFSSRYSPSGKAAEVSAQFKNVTIRNVSCEKSGGNGISIEGLPSMPHENLTFENVVLKNSGGVWIRNLKNSNFKNVKLINTDKRKISWKVLDAENISFTNCIPKPKISK